MIVAQANTLHGPWPAGMTLFVFDAAYGRSASVSPPAGETELCYRDAALAIVNQFKARFDLAAPCRMPDIDYFFSGGSANVSQACPQAEHRQ